MAKWYEGKDEINCSLDKIVKEMENVGECFVGVVKMMPGITSAELIEQGDQFTTIKTNEGLMKRTKISLTIKKESVMLEFDEDYQANKLINVKSHILDEFIINGESIAHRLVISDVKATGFMGFFYKNFGKINIGSSILNAYKNFFEK